MKLKEYLSLMEPGAELTCWDRDVDSEFYFYTKNDGERSLYDEDFPNVNKCEEMLEELLDVVCIRSDGIEVNLYELLEHPDVIKFAKANMFEEHQYEDDSDVSMLLFDDVVKNLSNGYEEFSKLMVQCLNYAFLGEKAKEAKEEFGDFADDEEKMKDFHKLSKEEFLASYSYLTDAEYEATKKKVLSEQLNISLDMVVAGYNAGVIKLMESPNGDGVVCGIGDNWFYFGGHTAEEYKTVKEFQSDIPTDTIIQEIYETLNVFSTDFEDEYLYYSLYLRESGISGKEREWIDKLDEIDQDCIYQYEYLLGRQLKNYEEYHEIDSLVDEMILDWGSQKEFFEAYPELKAYAKQVEQKPALDKMIQEARSKAADEDRPVSAPIQVER